MGNRRRPLIHFPVWATTIGAMKDGNVRADYRCDGCDAFGQVDLDKLIAAKGRVYSLANRRSRCRRSGCFGWIRFYYMHGVMRPLWNDDAVARWAAAARAVRIVHQGK